MRIFRKWIPFSLYAQLYFIHALELDLDLSPCLFGGREILHAAIPVHGHIAEVTETPATALSE